MPQSSETNPSTFSHSWSQRLEALRDYGNHGVAVWFEGPSASPESSRSSRMLVWRHEDWELRLSALLSELGSGSTPPLVAPLDVYGRAITADFLLAHAALARRQNRWIASALLEGKLSAEHQPVVDLGSGRVVAYESFLRLVHAGRAILPVALFRAAEKVNLLGEVDALARQTCLQSARELLAPGQSLILNLSTQLPQPTDLRGFGEEAMRAGLDPRALVLEFSLEHVPTLSAEWIRTLSVLRALGLKISLSRLVDLNLALVLMDRIRPEIVKLSPDLVPERGGTPSQSLCDLVRVAHAWGILVGVQGVENPDQVHWAQELGADLGQGWHFDSLAQQAA